MTTFYCFNTRTVTHARRKTFNCQFGLSFAVLDSSMWELTVTTECEAPSPECEMSGQTVSDHHSIDNNRWSYRSVSYQSSSVDHD